MQETTQNDAVRFLLPRPVQPHKPLFVFLPGMDGSGTLLETQLNSLGPCFDLRCLSIPPQDETGWTRLTRQVVQLIRDEISRAADAATTSAATTSAATASAATTSAATALSDRSVSGEAGFATGRKKLGANKLRLPKLKSQRSPQKPQKRVRRSVYLCGESFGGCLAMHVLTHAPELFDRVILINPASSFRRLPWMQLGQMITQRLPSNVYRYGALGLVPFLIDPFRVARRDRKALEKAMDAVPPKTAAWRMSLLSRFEVERLPLERMAHPVLLVAGGSDRLLPSQREVRDLGRRFPNAQQHLLPKSGHACLLEQGVNLQKIMRQYEFIPADLSLE